MQQLRNLLNGKKTYITGFLMILVAAANMAGLPMEVLTVDDPAQMLLEGFAVMSGRRGIAKVGELLLQKLTT